MYNVYICRYFNIVKTGGLYLIFFNRLLYITLNLLTMIWIYVKKLTISIARKQAHKCTFLLVNIHNFYFF